MPVLTEILETALYAEDLPGARHFYGDLLGLEEITHQPDRHVFYRCGKSILLIFKPSATVKPHAGASPVPAHGATGAGHVCFVAARSEIIEWKHKFLSAGMAIDAEFDWPNGAHSLYVRDPAGNSVEFAERHLWD